jgi:DNA-binding transcriptional regulator YhcF (GntR family)
MHACSITCRTEVEVVTVLLTVEPDAPVPIYQQIRDRIVEAIANGEQPAGSPLPSTRQLAVDLGINFHTVNKAYDVLRQEGLVRLSRKSGTVVARDARSGPATEEFVTDWGRRLQILLAEATAQGMPAGQVVEAARAAVAAYPPPSQK